MGVLDELKSIGKIFQEAGKIDLYKQILEAQNELLEMKNKISELEIENRDLKEKISIKEKLVKKNEAYYFEDDIRKESPFCTRCYDCENKTVCMIRWADRKKCPNCEKTYLA